MNGLILNLSRYSQAPYLFCDDRIKALPVETKGYIQRIHLLASQIFYRCSGLLFSPFYAIGKWVQKSIEPVEAKKNVRASRVEAIREYRKICAECPQLEPEAFPEMFEAGLKAGWKNRYSNILPNETTRFAFDDPDGYYNANVVLDGRAIAAQGPTHRTIDDFWKMVWESGSDDIVMVTDLIERGREKCARYWPVRVGEIQKVGHQFVVMLDESSERVDGFEIKKRTFLLKNGREERQVVQNHFCKWEDHGVISAKALAAFAKRVKKQSDERPVIVHCSAGIGRTGTFLAIYEALLDDVKDPESIQHIVRNLRRDRNGMIQTVGQYCLVQDALQELG